MEIKGYRARMPRRRRAPWARWVPGVNNLHDYGRWAFAEFTEVFAMESDFAARVEAEFARMVDSDSSTCRR